MIQIFDYYGVMRYRLQKDGPNSLRDYLKERYTLTDLADRVGITNQTLHGILNGDRDRPRQSNLEAIAKVTGLHLGVDDKGVYFEPPLDIDPELGSVSEKLNIEHLAEFLRIIKDFRPDQMKSLEDFARFLKMTQKKEEEQ